ALWRRHLMIRKAHVRTASCTKRADSFRPAVESLESREMLSGQDLLVSVYDDTAGLSVLRYNDVTYAAAPGGVATGDNSLFSPQGLAVSSDGSFYVSNPVTKAISHYDNSGTFENAIPLPSGGPLNDPLPGHLEINPGDGLLYAADIGNG